VADIDDVLLQALVEPDPARRRRLLSSAPSGPCGPTTLTRLVAALHDDSDVGVRTAAMEALATVGVQALPALDGLLDDPQAGIRRLVVDILGLMSTAKVLPLLRRAVNDQSLAVRSAALEGIARLEPSVAGPILAEQLVAGVPAAVALAALLGIEQLQVTVPVASLRRWTDDPLTAAVALRLLGRAGEFADLMPALSAPSRLRVRAAILGLADGLERGRRLVAGSLNATTRARLAAGIVGADVDAASAAIIVLAHAGDLGGVAAALARTDLTRLLPALHRAVAVAQGLGLAVEPALAAMASGTTLPALDVVKELDDAAKRRSGRSRSEAPLRAAPIAFSSSSFADLTAWLARAAGLAFGDDARSRLEARLLPRLEVRGAGSLAEYLDLLQRDPDEAAIAIDAVTVHETYFFREPASLDGLRDDIGPVLGAGGRAIHAWSAGCSSGEEPFTIAMILAGLERDGRCGPFEVLGYRRVAGLDRPRAARCVRDAELPLAPLA
jgi:HEAT repeat protein